MSLVHLVADIAGKVIGEKHVPGLRAWCAGGVSLITDLLKSSFHCVWGLNPRTGGLRLRP